MPRACLNSLHLQTSSTSCTLHISSCQLFQHHRSKLAGSLAICLAGSSVAVFSAAQSLRVSDAGVSRRPSNRLSSFESSEHHQIIAFLFPYASWYNVSSFFASLPFVSATDSGFCRSPGSWPQVNQLPMVDLFHK